MRLRILSLALLGCAFCVAAVAQVAAPLAFADPAPPALETISKNIDEVRLVLTVADKHGKFIKGLGPADLAIYDAGRSVDKLTFFGAESELPLRMAVLVDVSGSMFAQFGFERRLAEDFFKRVVRPQDSAEIIAFHVETFELGRGEKANQELKKIRKESARFGTAVWDSVRSACALLNSRPDERSRKALLLITDGEDNSSHIGVQQAIEAAWQTEVTVFVANTNHYQSRPELARLARETGGQMWSGGTSGEVVSAFRHLQENLRSQYVLAYRVPEMQAGFHALRVVPANKKFRALCRRGYYALARKPKESEP